MTILEDVGNKVGQHTNISAWCEANGVRLRRQKLNVGDYQSPPRVAVDTKKGLHEIYANIVCDHERFKSECIRAQEDGIHLVFLIEDTKITSFEDAKKWVNPLVKKYEREWGLIIRAQKVGKMLSTKVPKPPVSSERLVGMMDAMQMKYGCEFRFCHPDKTGETIYKILSESG